MYNECYVINHNYIYIYSLETLVSAKLILCHGYPWAILGAVFHSQSVGFWSLRWPWPWPGLKVSTTSFHVSGTKPDLSMEVVDLQIVPWRPRHLKKAFEWWFNVLKNFFEMVILCGSVFFSKKFAYTCYTFLAFGMKDAVSTGMSLEQNGHFDTFWSCQVACHCPFDSFQQSPCHYALPSFF